MARAMFLLRAQDQKFRRPTKLRRAQASECRRRLSANQPRGAIRCAQGKKPCVRNVASLARDPKALRATCAGPGATLFSLRATRFTLRPQHSLPCVQARRVVREACCVAGNTFRAALGRGRLAIGVRRVAVGTRQLARGAVAAGIGQATLGMPARWAGFY